MSQFDTQFTLEFSLQEYDEKTDIEVKAVKVDKSALERYVQLEKEIHASEGKNVLKALRAKEDQLKELEDNVARLQAVHDECVKQT